MRHKINSTVTVITFETTNPFRSEPTERFSYYIAYRDSAGDLRQSEEMSGFISHEDALSDAKRWIDRLDMTPEVKTVKPARITVPYHVHICKQACGVHRCVNPKCEIAGEFVPKRVAEIICPTCGDQTGTSDYFERQKLSIAGYKPLEVEQALAA
jgi:hypothetical protein